jgi:hypothetical protein
MVNWLSNYWWAPSLIILFSALYLLRRKYGKKDEISKLKKALPRILKRQ